MHVLVTSITQNTDNAQKKYEQKHYKRLNPNSAMRETHLPKPDPPMPEPEIRGPFWLHIDYVPEKGEGFALAASARRLEKRMCCAACGVDVMRFAGWR
jgi:hypothetical protein